MLLSNLNYKWIPFNYNTNTWTNILYKLLIILITIFSIFFLFNNKTNVVNYITEKNELQILNNTSEKLFWKNEISLNLEEVKEEIKYFNLIDISYENAKDFIKRENPKVSLVIAAHNQEKYIKLIYKSILLQELKDIEIIFIDDASNDNTSLIIKDLMKKDKRIIYLKNDEQKGAFYSRNRGILKSKGEYILVVDPDDLLVNNILIKVYETAKKYNLDIVQFYALCGDFESQSLLEVMKYKSGILKNNSEIKNNFYNTISRNLWDKLIRREIYVESVKFTREEFYNQLYFLNSDDTAFFGVLHKANTYGFLEQIGYFFIFKPKGSYIYRLDTKNMNLIFRSVFNNMKYFYMQSENTTSEKSNLAFKYFYKNYEPLVKYLPYVTQGLDFILDTLDLYLNSSYFSFDEKKNLGDFKAKVINQTIEIKILNKSFLL